MDNISWQDIRKVILDFLQQRLANNSSYKSETAKLEKAKELGDQVAVNEVQQKLDELAKRFEFETWMEDAATRRISWITIGTHLSKGIHSSSSGDNVNIATQSKLSHQTVISSATPFLLELDSSGNAASLDIFSLFNQCVGGKKILQVIMENHPAVLPALSDDKQKALLYLANFKKAIFGDFEHPKASELNKQIYWPNSQQTYLSQQDNNYRLLIPLHPSSLCHLVYQKVQSRFSDENKKAREQRRIKDIEHQSYFSFQDLAVVKLGGSNPQGVSQLTSNQGGRNFLLPSMPPKFQKPQFPSITNFQETIFNSSFQYYCRYGFKLLFDTVEAKKNIFVVRNNRKEAFFVILTLILKFVAHIQMTKRAGWSRESSLNLTQQLWLDPKRVMLDGETNFKIRYEKGDWQQELEKQFAFWIQTILKEKFKNFKQQFADPEFSEWRREFNAAVKASQRKREGIF
ncbi:type I-F CRISPR-associated protein Csy1 [Gilliamella sp. BG2]|uniref:type I-F CRISPR-associated protein Csy1 n=1 Tax=Gilliamella sp. BG2 TaxID=3351509 RepID=UPI0039858FC8